MPIYTELRPGATERRVSINESCELSGLGRTFLYKAIANGELIARKAGRRTIILPPDLEAYLRNLPETSEAAA